MSAGTDLALIAMVRRVFLEEGLELTPDMLGARESGMGPIETWINSPLPHLAGSTLLNAFRSGLNEEAIRAAVRGALRASEAGATGGMIDGTYGS